MVAIVSVYMVAIIVIGGVIIVVYMVAIGYYECLYGASGRFRLCRNAYLGIYIRKVDGTVKFILTHKAYLYFLPSRNQLWRPVFATKTEVMTMGKAHVLLSF
jgi:hypothetical protein